METLKSANAFEVVAREWFDNRTHEWVPSSAETTLARLEQHVLPKLGPRPIAEISAPEVLGMLRVVEARGTLETARRVIQLTGQIFMYAIATGRADRNPVPDLRGALKPRSPNITPSSRQLSCRNISGTWRPMTVALKPSWLSGSCC